MTEDAFKYFEQALLRAQESGDAQKVEYLRDVLRELQSELANNPQGLARTRELLELLQSAEMVEVPSHWIDNALTRIRGLEQAAAGQSGWLDRAKERIREAARIIEANLTVDTFSGQVLQGIRGAGALGPRQLLFESELGDIHLQVDSQAAGHSVMGQFVPRTQIDLESASVRVATSDKEVTAPLDNDAQFHIPDVSHGEVSIYMDLGTDSIRLTPFQLLAPREE